MIQNKLFRKHFFLFSAILVGFMLLGFFMTQYLVNSVQERFGPLPAVFFSTFVDRFPREERLDVIGKLQTSAEAALTRRYQLVDENGRIIFPKNTKLNFDWDKVKKPVQVHSQVSGGSHERHDPSGYDIARLAGEPPEYLVLTFSGPTKGEGTVFIASLAIYASSLFFGIGVALYVMFRSMKQNVELADSVISELQSGNLKVRFPITKFDEVGQVMIRFNKMADEIERLVDQVRSVELTRIKLLQELAHDLRTPVASLKNLVETVYIKGENLAPVIRSELMMLSLKEIDYFEQLVEDLLVLAQVSEPRYNPRQVSTSIKDLIEEEAISAQKKTPDKKLKIKVDESLDREDFEIYGDPHLLRRLLRNSFENAFSFASGQVNVNLREENSREISIFIEDDGPGFSSEALKTFGERRVSRVLGSSQVSGRLSVGLGSVIMKAIVDAHRGSLVVSNRNDTRGASVILKLPVGVRV